MRYLGGKSRISKDISNYINSVINDRPLVSLFCGSCSIESKVNSSVKILNDSQSYLIAMWKDVQNGRIFPNKINFLFCISKPYIVETNICNHNIWYLKISP